MRQARRGGPSGGGYDPGILKLLKVCRNLEALPNSDKLTANFTDADWKPPLFNVWTFAMADVVRRV